MTDPLFAPLARRDGIEFLSLPDAIEQILQRAERRDRLIVAWSSHEREVVERYAPEKLARFEARYVNARLVAVRWRNACHGGRRPAGGTLAEYLELIDYPVPSSAGRGRAGETIRIIRRSLEKGAGRAGLAGLTDNQLRRWGDLREHNLHDCAGMRRVCLVAARETVARTPGEAAVATHSSIDRHGSQQTSILAP